MCNTVFLKFQLPLAFLKTGYLLVPPEGDTLAPHSDWKRLWFVLDHEALYQVQNWDICWESCFFFLSKDCIVDSLDFQVDKTTLASSESSPTKTVIASNNFGLRADNSYRTRIEVSDICGLSSCADLSLPPGAGFEIDTILGQKYLVRVFFKRVLINFHLTTHKTWILFFPHGQNLSCEYHKPLLGL